jgi:hypothetical protein
LEPIRVLILSFSVGNVLSVLTGLIFLYGDRRESQVVSTVDKTFRSRVQDILLRRLENFQQERGRALNIWECIIFRVPWFVCLICRMNLVPSEFLQRLYCSSNICFDSFRMVARFFICRAVLLLSAFRPLFLQANWG